MSQEIEIPFQGLSMLPTLRPGDLLQVELCPLEQLRENDIAVVSESHEIVCHRVIKINSRLYLKGDAALQLVPLDRSIITWGRVKHIQRNGQIGHKTQLSRLKYYLNQFYTQEEMKIVRWMSKGLGYFLK